jgi:hypothetical protein
MRPAQYARLKRSERSVEHRRQAKGRNARGPAVLLVAAMAGLGLALLAAVLSHGAYGH